MGEEAPRFRIYQTDPNGNPVGQALGEYDSETELLAYRRRADQGYVIYEQRQPGSDSELWSRIWTCPICAQQVITRRGYQPSLARTLCLGGDSALSFLHATFRLKHCASKFPSEAIGSRAGSCSVERLSLATSGLHSAGVSRSVRRVRLTRQSRRCCTVEGVMPLLMYHPYRDKPCRLVPRRPNVSPRV
jgi:hypothetical protein